MADAVRFSMGEEVDTMRSAIRFFALLTVAVSANAAAIKEVTAYAGPPGGRDLFAGQCASCHGLDGKGRGPAAVAFRVPPPDLTTLSLRNHRNFPFVRVSGTIAGDLSRPEYITRQMPSFGLMFRSVPEADQRAAQRRIAALTEYIRTLQAK